MSTGSSLGSVVVGGAVVGGAVVGGAVVGGAVVGSAVVGSAVVGGAVVLEPVSSGMVSPVTFALLPSVVSVVLSVVEVPAAVVDGVTPVVVSAHRSVVDERSAVSLGAGEHTPVLVGVVGGGGVTGAESMVVLVIRGSVTIGPAGAVDDGAGAVVDVVDLEVSTVVGRFTVGGVGPGPVVGGAIAGADVAGGRGVGGGSVGAGVVGPAASAHVSTVVVG